MNKESNKQKEVDDSNDIYIICEAEDGDDQVGEDAIYCEGPLVTPHQLTLH